MGEMRNAYEILVRNPEKKSPLLKPGSRWDKPSYFIYYLT
jgi:hypothetical protein